MANIKNTSEITNNNIKYNDETIRNAISIFINKNPDIDEIELTNKVLKHLLSNRSDTRKSKKTKIKY